MLAYADHTKPFRVHTDASELGLGAVLYQEQDDGTTRVIAFASHSLSNSEQRDHLSKLEFLALKWAIHERFHEYLYGSNFEVYTDNNPLTYIMSSAKLDATAQQWVAALATYHFKIFYRSGKQNIEADAVSQIEWSNSDVAATLEQGCVLESSLPLIPNDTIVSKVAHVNLGPKITNEDWQKEQVEDPHISRVLELMKQDKPMSYKSARNDPSGLRVYLKFRKDLVLKNKLLYRKVKLKSHDTSVFQFVLPHSFCNHTLTALHDNMGHLGMDRTLGLVQDRFFWPGMCESVHTYICTCDRYTQFKQAPEKAEMHPIETSYPMELVHMDFLTIGKPNTDKMINILIITDHFTKYAQAYVTPNQTAPVVACTFWENFLVHYGWPVKILTDQGKCFESELVKELCSMAQVQKIRTMPYHPETNGACEHFNSTLINMLGTLPVESKKEWQDWVSTMTHAYNCTISHATGYKPYYLMYSHEPRLAVDVEYGVTMPTLTNNIRHNYIKKLQARLKWAFGNAKDFNQKEINHHKQYYDRKVKCMALCPDDIVLV